MEKGVWTGSCQTSVWGGIDGCMGCATHTHTRAQEREREREGENERCMLQAADRRVAETLDVDITSPRQQGFSDSGTEYRAPMFCKKLVIARAHVNTTGLFNSAALVKKRLHEIVVHARARPCG